MGGNSKTSLIVAASPCSYDNELLTAHGHSGEDVVKKVKTNAKINKELSPGEMGKEIKKLEKEVEILTYDNELDRGADQDGAAGLRGPAAEQDAPELQGQGDAEHGRADRGPPGQ